MTPALVRWRLVRDGRAVIPWRVAADFRGALLTGFRFREIYAGGTRQNKPPASGRYRFWLAARGTRAATATAATGSTSRWPMFAATRRAGTSSSCLLNDEV